MEGSEGKMTFNMTLKERFWYWVIRKVCLWSPHHSISIIANRFIRRMEFGSIKMTIISENTLLPAAYSREELLSMLCLIREQEERMEWKVPEPHKCVYCNHVSPADIAGHCPVVKTSKVIHNGRPQKISCLCFHHQEGLHAGLAKAINEDLGFPVKESNYESTIETLEALNG